MTKKVYTCSPDDDARDGSETDEESSDVWFSARGAADGTGDFFRRPANNNASDSRRPVPEIRRHKLDGKRCIAILRFRQW
jgi:hypothetical protein